MGHNYTYALGNTTSMYLYKLYCRILPIDKANLAADTEFDNRETTKPLTLADIHDMADH